MPQPSTPINQDAANQDSDWWKTATVYQIYPKSFNDTTGSGSGDINGITAKLDYLKHLGIDAIWLNPVYQSPMVDNGYDIADYYAINPDFGTMADFDRLLTEAHARGIRLIMDIVVNHTSTEHAWFQSALKEGKQSPYRDFYIWQDARTDSKGESTEPTNWQSKFGGSAWAWDENSQQYYLHLFATEQADLNWENPAVRSEVKNIISFWAEKGVDGFRLDVINLISKPELYQDDHQGDGRRFYTDGPKIHQYLQEISRDTFQKYGSVTVGEMSSTTLEHCQQYSRQDGRELSMVFNFHHLKVDYPNGDKWALAPMDFLELKRLFRHWQQGLHGTGWGALFWCNHDQPRIVSRFGCEGEYRNQSAKLLGAAIHLMQGTPYVYQGEELGMTNPGYTNIEQYQDIESHTMYELLLKQGKSKAEVLKILGQKSRDNSRAPMQWDNTEHAGFTSGTPWLQVADNYSELNAAQCIAQQDSVFHFYRQLIELRKQLPVITDGDYTDLLPEHPQLLCYQRRSPQIANGVGQTLLFIGNFYAETVTCQLPKPFTQRQGEWLLGNYPLAQGDETVQQSLQLRPFECRVLLITEEIT